jgi:hypothetical protein
VAETEEQRQQRLLDELKGKNVAHYSVMLAAYINARIDANRAILVLSSTGIGLLIAIANQLQPLGTCAKVAYVAALIAFFATACSTLWVYVSNAEAIESYVRGEGNSKPADFRLNAAKYVNYVFFATGLALALMVATIALFGSN